jgi:hypothetical protein
MTQTKCHELALFTAMFYRKNDIGANMIVLLDIEYLLKEVNDATIWFFILWN